MKDFYKLLGVATTATEQEIRAAFHRLAKQTHPDHFGGDKEREEQFKNISVAYGVLSDSAARAKYDAACKAAHEQAARAQAAREQAAREQAAPAPWKPGAPVWTPPPVAWPPRAAPKSSGFPWSELLGTLVPIVVGGFAVAAAESNCRGKWDPTVQRRRGKDGKFRKT
jgi:curved DNA-binding protein CbpA